MATQDKEPLKGKITLGTSGCKSQDDAPIPLSASEIQSVLDMVAEFQSPQLKVSVHETADARIVDIRTDTPERAEFIRHLIDKLRAKQQNLETMFQQELGEGA